MRPRSDLRFSPAFPLASAIAALLAATTVHAAILTWDNTAGGVINDGGGAWLGRGLWNNGAPRIAWSSGSAADFGNGGAGGAVTLASATTVASFIGTFGISLGGVGAVSGDNTQIYPTYTAVPEPAATNLGGLGMLTLLRHRRHA